MDRQDQTMDSVCKDDAKSLLPDSVFRACGGVSLISHLPSNTSRGDNGSRNGTCQRAPTTKCHTNFAHPQPNPHSSLTGPLPPTQHLQPCPQQPTNPLNRPTPRHHPHLLPPNRASSPIHNNPPIAQPIRVHRLEHARTHVNVVRGAALARVDYGGRVRCAGRRVVDVDRGPAFRVRVGVGAVGHDFGA